MVERISTEYKYAMLVADMKRNQFNFDKLTLQLSSGKKYTDITDSPIASVNILNTNRQLGQIETYKSNVGLASTELTALGDLMELANGYLTKAWDKAMQANNQTYGDSSLKALKTEIDEITKTMVDLANTEYNDNYIFGGANTQTVPFEIDENWNVIYKGTDEENSDYIRQTEVADGVFETINTTGDKVFGYYTNQEVSRDANGYELELRDDGKYYYKTKT
ncbi:flagellar hook-associated protein FlgL, partial [bacterium]|nr:flagellar hook-associated protein FlgL [bacterium]